MAYVPKPYHTIQLNNGPFNKRRNELGDTNAKEIDRAPCALYGEDTFLSLPSLKPS
jgi:hypothetical protein